MVFRTHSHKELNKFEDIDEVCKVVDVAIVPDTPGVCVAVTETFHDVASYHMLHADKQKDGTFALTSNSVDGRVLPEDIHYAAARALLLEFFSFTEAVNSAVKGAPKFGQGKVAIAVRVHAGLVLLLFSQFSLSLSYLYSLEYSLLTRTNHFNYQKIYTH